MSDPPSQPILNAPKAVTWIVGANLLVFLVQVFLPDVATYLVIRDFAFVAARYTLPGGWAAGPVAYLVSPVTYMFLHANFMHLALNMALFLAFGTAVARRMGPVAFLTLYATTGVWSAIFWCWLQPGSLAPLIGASGAVSGMVGAIAFLSFRPRSLDRGPLPFRRRSTAVAFVVVWLIVNFVFGVVPLDAIGIDGDIAWEAHLGGFVAGFLLMPFFDGRGRIASDGTR